MEETLNTRSSSPMSVSSNSSASSYDSEEAERRSSRWRTHIGLLVNSLQEAITNYSRGLYDKRAYHTSALTGHAWVLELLTGHPSRIQCELGVRHHVFEKLIEKLREMGHSDSRNVTLEEQLAIFLYTCVTGLTIRHVGERFQRANGTISLYVYFFPVDLNLISMTINY
jgi:hypothetical protein